MPAAVITDHSIRRWIERVQPGESRSSAGPVLQAFLAGAEVLHDPPKWARRALRGTTDRVAVNPTWPGTALILNIATFPQVRTVITEQDHDPYTPRPPRTLRPLVRATGTRTKGRDYRHARHQLQEE
jgi:hypothetical protein